jgi:tRNA(Ile2)-agmatinylcytidine synthase
LIDYDIIGYPRLVRLNPNIPWKTRGNGAISLQVGKEGKKKLKIGEIDEEDIVISLELKQDIDKSDCIKIKKIIKKIIKENARTEDKNTNPGFVLLKTQPNNGIYKKAVTKIITLNEIKIFLHSKKADFKGYKNCRGLIGATSAVSWLPSIDKTFELISYRQKKRWGTKRYVDSESVKKMDKSVKTTFDNYDYKNNHNRLVPNSPCPILYGIRGEVIKDLIQTSSIVKSEPVDSWLIFETNQGTDDHLQKKKVKDIEPYQSVIVKGSVSKNPVIIKGGHVIFTIKDSTGRIDCAAYEPTKEFRDIVKKLFIGDIVEIYGGIREQPLTINIEKIYIEQLATIFKKVENPVCLNCGKHMKSKGRNQGYKCKICGTKSNNPIMNEIKRTIQTGFYEVPICARRHLSKPLKRSFEKYN